MTYHVYFYPLDIRVCKPSSNKNLYIWVHLCCFGAASEGESCTLNCFLNRFWAVNVLSTPHNASDTPADDTLDTILWKWHDYWNWRTPAAWWSGCSNIYIVIIWRKNMINSVTSPLLLVAAILMQVPMKATVDTHSAVNHQPLDYHIFSYLIVIAEDCLWWLTLQVSRKPLRH